MQNKMEMRRTIGICVALCILTFGAFYPVLQNGFVNYDDTAYVTENPPVLAGITAPGIAWAFDGAHFANWHPITWLSHMLDVQLFGLQAGGHHFTSLLFHVANTALLFLLLQRMTLRSWPSAMVAALFALHPLHVESVAWVSERKDVLSTFFALLSLLACVRYVGAAAAGRGFALKAGFYVASLVLFALGLMSKAMVVTLPALMLLLDYWPLQRFHFGEQGGRRAALSVILEKIPFFLMAVGAFFLAFTYLKQSGATNDAANVWLGERLMRMVASYQHYIGKTFWPTGLIVPAIRPTYWRPFQIVVCAGTFLGVSGVAIWLWRRCPYLFVGWFWFVGTLLPVVGVVPVGAHLFADRYTYFPLVGLFIVIVWGVVGITSTWENRATFLTGAAAVTLVACIIATNLQVRHWRDSEFLYRHTLALTPGNYLAHNGLGLYLASQNRRQEAMGEYVQAIRINPQYDDAYSNLGRAFAEEGNYPEAVENFESALHLKPDDLKTLNNYGSVLILQKRYADAAPRFQRILQLQPDHFNAHNNLAVCWRKLGKTSDAISEYHEAIRLQPNFLEALNNLAWILATDPDAKFRNGAEAIELATRANEMTRYQNLTLLTTLAAAYAEAGRYQEAVSFAQQARMRVGDQEPLGSQLDLMVHEFEMGTPHREK